MSKVTGPWTLADLAAGKIGAKKNGLNVFTCFHCGGGSSMGYKLAGFNVLGGVEIDPKMMALYRANLKPDERFSFQYPVQEFKVMSDKLLPKEIFSLDILDGSPPCSSFSTSGSREDAWGKEKKFREGQAVQILDDLFFHYIDIAKKLQPKVVVAENVKGLILGNAKGYVVQIFEAFRAAGYETQLFLFNASRMGVPQLRERTVFIARRRDLKMPPLKFSFDEPVISFEQAMAGTSPVNAKALSATMADWWKKVSPGKRVADFHPKKHMWDTRKVHRDHPLHTLTASNVPFHWKEPRYLSPSEIIRVQSFPEDYDFLGQDPGYVCGMSVPPLMMQRISLEIGRQLFGKSVQTRVKKVVPNGHERDSHPGKPPSVP